jgi:UDP:flavonoid glycosyltransferase YjiC (YdhE family)
VTRKRICLFPHMGYLSETSRMVEVYKALRDSGVEPLVATHGGTYEWVLDDEGINYEIIEPRMSHEQCQAFVKANRVDGQAGQFYTVDELEAFVLSEIEFLREREVGVALTGFNLSLGLSARKAGVRYCVTHLASWSPIVFERQMQTPYNYFTEKIPRFVPRSWLRRIVNWIYLNSKMLIKPFNIVARRLDIEPIHSTLDMFMGDITIVTEAPEILGIEREDLEGWVPHKPALFHDSPRLCYAGSMYAKLFGMIPREVQSFLNAGGPIIYVALTSTRDDYLRELVTALLSLDMRLLVVSTVHELVFEHEQLFVASHLPSHLVMPLVDLAIIHGGQGSVQTAVASGTPIIGFPLQTEQMFNLELIHQQGAGINMPLQHLGCPDKVCDKVRTVLGDASFKKNMEALKLLQEKYDGPREVAHILMEEAEALFQTSPNGIHRDGK